MTDLLKAEERLQIAREGVRTLIVMAMRPNLTPERVELIKSVERLARAEVKMRVKLLKRLRSQTRAD